MCRRRAGLRVRAQREVGGVLLRPVFIMLRTQEAVVSGGEAGIDVDYVILCPEGVVLVVESRHFRLAVSCAVYKPELEPPKLQ